MVICVSNDALSFTTDIFHHYLDIVCVSIITVSSTLEDPVLLTPDLHWTCSPECPPPEGQGGGAGPPVLCTAFRLDSRPRVDSSGALTRIRWIAQQNLEQPPINNRDTGTILRLHDAIHFPWRDDS